MGVIFLCVLCCLLYMANRSGVSGAYNLSCDATGLIYNGTSETQGTVDKSLIKPESCLLRALNRIVFRITTVGGSKIDLCNTPYSSEDPTYETMGNSQCRYLSHSGDIWTYEVTFFFEERFLEGTMEITSDCTPHVVLLPPGTCRLDDVCHTRLCPAKQHCVRPSAECVCNDGEDCRGVCGFCDFSDCSDVDNGRMICIIIIAGCLVVVISKVILVVLYCFFRTHCDGICSPLFRAIDTCFAPSSTNKAASGGGQQVTEGGPTHATKTVSGENQAATEGGPTEETGNVPVKNDEDEGILLSQEDVTSPISLVETDTSTTTDVETTNATSSTVNHHY